MKVAIVVLMVAAVAMAKPSPVFPARFFHPPSFATGFSNSQVSQSQSNNPLGGINSQRVSSNTNVSSAEPRIWHTYDIRGVSDGLMHICDVT